VLPPLPSDDVFLGEGIAPAYLLGIGAKRNCASFASARFSIVQHGETTAKIFNYTGERLRCKQQFDLKPISRLLPPAVGGWGVS
jgi:hypothetical protein